MFYHKNMWRIFANFHMNHATVCTYFRTSIHARGCVNKNITRKVLALVMMPHMSFIVWTRPKMKWNNYRREGRKTVGNRDSRLQEKCFPYSTKKLCIWIHSSYNSMHQHIHNLRADRILSRKGRLAKCPIPIWSH